MEEVPKPEELIKIDYEPPVRPWMDTKPEFRPGNFCHASSPKWLDIVDYPHPRQWSVTDDDWKLPEHWKDIILEGMHDRLDRFRSFRLFMDICVRCGACADKCHFFIGTGDPKNMPVMRAELLRSIYRKHHTMSGKLLGKLGGARELDEDVLKEWFYYLYQCTECRRCSLFCPYGIDMAELTILGRELLSSVGINIEWAMASIASCYEKGNHIGAPPHAYYDMIDFFCDECEEATGIRPHPSFNRKGAEILFVTPSGDYFADPGTYTFMGYLLLFEYLGLDYTISGYAAEGGNFGYFVSHEMGKRLNYKIYSEAKRLGVKWILGGECGHMWRVLHQYMDTWNGPADFLEEPVSPFTGTRFENAKSTKMVHVCEFTADLIKHGKLNLDASRNDHIVLTYHDSCNPARGMGILEEPRYIIRNVCNSFHEMPDNTIRENTFCCGSGASLNSDEYLEMRFRGGLPRANAVRYVHEKYGVNHLGCICAIDRAVFPALLEYWVPEVDVIGIHEMVANALVFPGEGERKTDLRGRPFKGVKPEEIEEEE
jgi:Fe-S oxidoreductase